MDRSAWLLLPAAVVALSAAWADHPAKPADEKPFLFPEQGRHRFPIATKSPEAQKFFDQGMTLMYGFNHAEAVHSFRHAAELDPKTPMPHWGIGLALGPNYNRGIDPVDAARNKAAYDAVQKALALSAAAPPREQAYVKALAKRYSIDPKADGRQLDVDYRNAMREVAKAYPDDLDAATLYAEAIMNLRPWQLWDAQGRPAEGTEQAVRVLESVLRRYPDHCGANHYYIHALEASPYPERALASAERLLRVVPWAGHLVHMPAHVYIHTGDYDLAAWANERAVQADEEYLKLRADKGVYRMMYYHHNIHFLAFARAMEGKWEEAKQAADKLAASVAPDVPHMPMLEGFQIMPLTVMLRCHRWDDVLKVPAPDAKRPVSTVFRHYARAVALSVRGKKEEAAQERQAFEAARKAIPPETPFGFNSAGKVLGVAAAVLDARLAADPKTAIGHWKKAVELEDGLTYNEPPDWYYPVRESLGAALLRDGSAAEAEEVFREDLKRHRRSGRALFGLRESLKAQKKSAAAELVGLEFERAWKKGHPLRIEDF